MKEAQPYTCPYYTHHGDWRFGLKRAIIVALLAITALATAAILAAPLAYADPGDQATAEQAVHTAYDLEITQHCYATRNVAPSFQSIDWEYFNPTHYGRGNVHDAKPGLGGPFEAYYETTTHFPPGRLFHV
jgi:hypothetical protein